ncbi:MAG: glycosyltransferase [Xanthobacteraceae bacterium]|nr:MAG: glycosyltransferase [Xanthobacteraceae bacterium]
MKIGLAIISFAVLGGKQRDCLELARYLRARGHEVEIVTAVRGTVQPTDVTVHALPLPLAWTNHGIAMAFARAMARLATRRGYDAVVAFDKLPGSDYYYASDVCFTARSHGLRSWLPRHRVLCGLERALFAPPSATHVFFLTERQRADYAACHGEAPGGATVLPVIRHHDRGDTPDFYATRALVRRELDLPPEAPVAVNIATKPHQKGADRLLATLAAVPELFAVIAGSDDPAILSAATALGVEARVRTLPYVLDIPRLFGACDLMVHPARVEAGGIVILEALAAGVPVIATALCGYAPEIARANAGRVQPEPFAQAALDDAVRNVLAAGEGYKAAARAAASDLKERPSWLAVIADTIEHGPYRPRMRAL